MSGKAVHSAAFPDIISLEISNAGLFRVYPKTRQSLWNRKSHEGVQILKDQCLAELLSVHCLGLRYLASRD